MLNEVENRYTNKVPDTVPPLSLPAVSCRLSAVNPASPVATVVPDNGVTSEYMGGRALSEITVSVCPPDIQSRTLNFRIGSTVAV